MTRFHWVRHGPTHARVMVGWSDLPADLSDTAALARLSSYLPQAPVISSTLSRAAATADAIIGARRRLPHDPDLREINFGAWELQRATEVTDQAHIRRYWEEPGDIAPPGGESWNTVCARVNRAVDRLTGHQDIIIVAHFGVILTQVQRALGISAYDAFAHKIDPLSVTQITFDGAWSAGRINHLP
ncbi:histidine phosphatase family protein (plasmid) [Pseudorhodobacter turbinis]|uniref:Histidine phosphatase family protein n=1 Tax=Pseudorhodobacter turbinis TaxID=2500533 RepID=A0A4P8EIR5_9RHOB|nr:histidine phosphatase family protein [Pseudorhodobacter turbinis]QCO56723.1 histidine phosphatase family protein [Pseudorhodobacter turbinis]